jgi:hypothetical protein
MKSLNIFGFAAVMLLSFIPNEPAAAGGGYPGCNCSRPVARSYAPPAPRGEVCVTACMSDSDWARCATKSWWADSKNHADKTPRFFAQCGRVCRPYNSPRLGYRAASGNWVVFRFGPNS